VQRRHLNDAIVDACWLQEARAYLFDRIVAAREDDPCRDIVACQGHKVAEGVARRPFEQPLDALDKNDLAALRGKNGAHRRGIRRHLRGEQRGVEMRLREFLDSETKNEMRGREGRDGVFANRGLAAAGGTCDEDDLDILERVENLLDEPGPLEMEIVPD